MRIVIVGAGVAGCIMARTLARVPGLDVTCLERVMRDDHSESGTGLNIGPNAVQALQAHDAPLAKAITDASFPWRDWKISLMDGTVLFDLPLSKVANNDGWRIRWSELYRVLREVAPGISYDCTITGSRPQRPRNPAKTFIAWTQNGSSHRLDDIDLLIATDGRYSLMRRIFSGEPPCKHVGVAISRADRAGHQQGTRDDYEQWFNGPNRLLAFRVPPDFIYIACAFPIASDQPIPEHQKRADALRKTYSPPGDRFTAQTRWLLDTICTHASEMHWARLQEHDVQYADPASNVLYLGDSAHGMVPTLGQGATQAIEDACFAADLLARELARGKDNALRECIDTIGRRAPGADCALSWIFRWRPPTPMLAGADPVAGTLHKTGPQFMAKLNRLYRDVPSSAVAAAKVPDGPSVGDRRMTTKLPSATVHGLFHIAIKTPDLRPQKSSGATSSACGNCHGRTSAIPVRGSRARSRADLALSMSMPADLRWGRTASRRSGTAAIDHISLSCSGFREYIARFKAAGLEWREFLVPGTTLWQLFVYDPSGVQLELTFEGAVEGAVQAGHVARTRLRRGHEFLRCEKRIRGSASSKGVA